MRATWPVMSEGEELVAPAYLGPAMSRALRTAVDVGVFHCTLLFICSRCVRKQHDYTATRCRHRAGGSLCKITVTANVWRQRRKHVLHQAQTNVESGNDAFA